MAGGGEIGMILIVGLGNPDEEYRRTRHNVGFLMIDRLKMVQNFPDFNFEKKFQAEIAQGKINGQKAILIKPQTFMNNSGKAVGAIVRFYKIKSENIWVIHDDADLPLGTLRIVKNRGSAGHKGVESIMRALKTQNFIRFRIGTKPTQSGKIPHRPSKEMAKFLVEKKITLAQEEIFKKTIKKCVEAIEMTIKDGPEKAMSTFN